MSVHVDVGKTMDSLTHDDAQSCVLDATDSEAALLHTVVLHSDEKGLRVLARRRKQAPYAGCWELPSIEEGAGAEESLLAKHFWDTEKAWVSRRSLGGHLTSSTWDPRYAKVSSRAIAYLLEDPPSLRATGQCEWVSIDDLSSGREVLAFEQASLLAKAFEPGGVRPDKHLASAFSKLAAAARVRSRTLTGLVNADRKAKGLVLRDSDEAGAKDDWDVLDGRAKPLPARNTEEGTRWLSW